MAMIETRAKAMAKHLHSHPDPASSGVQPMKMRKVSGDAAEKGCVTGGREMVNTEDAR